MALPEAQALEAIKCGDLKSELLKLLLQKSPYLDAVDIRGQTPLHYAIVDGGFFELLLKNGASINAEDHAGRTPLYLAIQSDETDVVKLLIDRGIDLAGRFRDGTTPTHLAARGNWSTLRLLCRQAQRLGLDIDCMDADGQTPLFDALLYSESYEFLAVRSLLETRSNLDRVYWMDRKRIRDRFATKSRRDEYWRLEPIGQLAIKLYVAHLVPSFEALDESGDDSDVSKYEEELERLKKCMIFRSMSLYDFLHDENRLTAGAICQMRHDLDTIMADFPNYRGLIEAKIKIDLA